MKRSILLASPDINTKKFDINELDLDAVFDSDAQVFDEFFSTWTKEASKTRGMSPREDDLRNNVSDFRC